MWGSPGPNTSLSYPTLPPFTKQFLYSNLMESQELEWSSNADSTLTGCRTSTGSWWVLGVICCDGTAWALGQTTGLDLRSTIYWSAALDTFFTLPWFRYPIFKTKINDTYLLKTRFSETAYIKTHNKYSKKGNFSPFSIFLWSSVFSPVLPPTGFLGWSDEIINNDVLDKLQASSLWEDRAQTLHFMQNSATSSTILSHVNTPCLSFPI